MSVSLKKKYTHTSFHRGTSKQMTILFYLTLMFIQGSSNPDKCLEEDSSAINQGVCLCGNDQCDSPKCHNKCDAGSYCTGKTGFCSKFQGSRGFIRARDPKCAICRGPPGAECSPTNIYGVNLISNGTSLIPFESCHLPIFGYQEQSHPVIECLRLVCFYAPECSNKGGIIVNDGDCQCVGHQIKHCGPGEYCSSTCHPTPLCSNTNGELPNQNCSCGNQLTPCTEGSYCLGSTSQCLDSPICTKNEGLIENDRPCYCGNNQNKCKSSGLYCHADVSRCSYRPCEHAEGFINETESCACGTNNCETGEHCYKDGNYCGSQQCPAKDGLTVSDHSCICNNLECQPNRFCVTESEVPDIYASVDTTPIYKIRTSGKCTDELGWDYVSNMTECETTANWLTINTTEMISIQHINPIRYMKIFGGECAGEELMIYAGRSDNPGTNHETRVQACADACANKGVKLDWEHSGWLTDCSQFTNDLGPYKGSNNGGWLVGPCEGGRNLNDCTDYSYNGWAVEACKWGRKLHNNAFKWEGFIVYGLPEHSRNGRCWCEAPGSMDCTRYYNHYYDRYDFVNGEYKPLQYCYLSTDESQTESLNFKMHTNSIIYTDSLPTGDDAAVSGCINHYYNPEVCQQTCSDDSTCMGVFVYHADHFAAGRCCYKSSWTGMGTTLDGDFYHVESKEVIQYTYNPYYISDTPCEYPIQSATECVEAFDYLNGDTEDIIGCENACGLPATRFPPACYIRSDGKWFYNRNHDSTDCQDGCVCKSANPHNTDHDIISAHNGACSEEHKCVCKNGIELQNEEKDIIVQLLTPIQSDNELFREIPIESMHVKENQCRIIPLCTEGDSPNTAACTCGITFCKEGQYCYKDENRCSNWPNEVTTDPGTIKFVSGLNEHPTGNGYLELNGRRIWTQSKRCEIVTFDVNWNILKIFESPICHAYDVYADISRANEHKIAQWVYNTLTSDEIEDGTWVAFTHNNNIGVLSEIEDGSDKLFKLFKDTYGSDVIANWNYGVMSRTAYYISDSPCEHPIQSAGECKEAYTYHSYEKNTNSIPTGHVGADLGCFNEDTYSPEVCQQKCTDDPTCLGVFVYHADTSAAGRCCYKSSWTGMGTTSDGDFYQQIASNHIGCTDCGLPSGEFPPGCYISELNEWFYNSNHEEKDSCQNGCVCKYNQNVLQGWGRTRMAWLLRKGVPESMIIEDAACCTFYEPQPLVNTALLPSEFIRLCHNTDGLIAHNTESSLSTCLCGRTVCSGEEMFCHLDTGVAFDWDTSTGILQTCSQFQNELGPYAGSVDGWWLENACEQGRTTNIDCATLQSYEQNKNSHPAGDQGAVSGCINEGNYDPNTCKQKCSDDPTCLGVFVYHPGEGGDVGRCCYKASWTSMGFTSSGNFYQQIAFYQESPSGEQKVSYGSKEACEWGRHLSTGSCRKQPTCTNSAREVSNIEDCWCSSATFCDLDTGRVCGSVGDERKCSKPRCPDVHATDIIMEKCECTPSAARYGDICNPAQFCYNPNDISQCGDSGNKYPNCGCVPTQTFECTYLDGVIRNSDITTICICGGTVCLSDQYCNKDFNTCSDTPVKSCTYVEGIYVNADTCFCHSEMCEDGGYYCNATRTTNKCHKKICSDYDDVEALCDSPGLGNGIWPGAECAGTSCSESDKDVCCKPCTSPGVVVDGLCRAGCGNNICQDDWVAPPQSVPYSQGNVSLPTFIATLNKYYTGYCAGKDCEPEDQQTCCVPAKKCSSQIADVFCSDAVYTGELIDRSCPDFECVPSVCCVQLSCVCTNGQPATGRNCPNPSDNKCIECDTEFWLNGIECISTRKCTLKEYELASPGKDTDRICVMLRSCNSQQYESVAATNTTDRECVGLHHCLDTEFVSNVPIYRDSLAITDRECQQMTVCSEGLYESTPPNHANGFWSTDRECLTYSPVCNQTEYEASPPGPTDDRECKPFATICSQNEYESAAKTRTSDKVCTAYSSECSSEEYESVAPTEISDRACRSLSQCSDSEYISVPALYSSDLICEPMTICSNNQFVLVQPSTTSDQVCQLLTVCQTDEYELVPPTGTTDRECKTCDPEDIDCKGCILPTDCAWEPLAKVIDQSKCSKQSCIRIIVNGTSTLPILRAGNWYRIEPVGDMQFDLEAPGAIQRTGYSYFEIEVDKEVEIRLNGVVFNIEQDCIFEEYTWAQCSIMCGHGHEMGLRGKKIQDAKHGGLACSETPQIITRDCEGILCPIACQVSWDDDFGSCHATCGHLGLQYRNYTVIVEPKYNGDACPAKIKRKCIGRPFPGFCDCRNRTADVCGVCGGDDSTCKGCDGIINSGYRLNACGKCAPAGTHCDLTSKNNLRKTKSNVLRIAVPVSTSVLLTTVLIAIVVLTKKYKPNKRKKRQFLT